MVTGITLDIAATLHALGQVSLQAGDLKQAKQHLDESLRMKRSLHRGQGSPLTLLCDTECTGPSEPGRLEISSKQSSKLPRMSPEANGALLACSDRDHPSIAATLRALGQVRSAGWRLSKCKQSQHLDESLRMQAVPCMVTGITLLRCCDTACTGPSESAGWRSQASNAALG